MKKQDIINEILNGSQFANESANWWSVSNPKNKVFMISINDKDFFYNNIDSFAKRIVQLLKRGY